MGGSDCLYNIIGVNGGNYGIGGWFWGYGYSSTAINNKYLFGLFVFPPFGPGKYCHPIIYRTSLEDLMPLFKIGSARGLAMCEGDTLELYVEPYDRSRYQYVWSNGKRDSSIKVTRGGQCHIMVKSIKDNTEYREATVNVIVFQITKDMITGPSRFCRGDTIELQCDREYVAYRWSTGDTTGRIRVWKSGRYEVMVTDTNGCVGKDTIDVVAEEVVAKIIGSRTICKGKSIELLAEPRGNQYRYLWSTGDTSERIEVKRGGTYWVVVTNDIGCEGIDSVEVKELPYLEFEIGGDSVLCSGEVVELFAPLRGSGYTYLWSTGETSERIRIGNGGRYWLRIEDENGCEGYDTIEVKEYLKPEAKIVVAGGRTSICKGEKLILRAEPIGDYRYFWSNGVRDAEIEIAHGGV